MAIKTYPPLDITTYWADLTDHLIELVDLVPDGKMNWSPSPEVWNFRGSVPGPFALGDQSSSYLEHHEGVDADRRR